MILTLIIKGEHINESNPSVYIVANPNSSTGPTYCLPLGIIWFGTGEAPIDWNQI
jgi:hypothetical protein